MLSGPTELQSFAVHVLEVMGLRGTVFADRVRVLQQPHACNPAQRLWLEQGGILLAVRPSSHFCAGIGVAIAQAKVAASELPAGQGVASRLRTLHPGDRYTGAGENLLVDAQGHGAWRFVPVGRGGVLLAGTDFARDLLCFRQGDPAAALKRPQEAVWDIAGERPIYLFDAQLRGLLRSEQRQADAWAWVAAKHLSVKAGVPLQPLLPGGAQGAVVLTGDDDQAYLEKYEEQLTLLRGQPVTYFLHPQTKHTVDSMARLFSGTRVELGIHPDALDAPQQYAQRLREQCGWFRDLTGSRALSLRNHGFLNDGYWGHLPAWLDEGVRISSNLPGLDGRPLNGSLLPARLADAGGLTSHWSVVTAIGDGVRYVDGGCSDKEAARCVYDCADQIRTSGIPGVMVLNLHPQNVSDTAAMHHAAVDVIRSGFLAWTMQDCLEWFEKETTPPRPSPSWLDSALGLMAHIWPGDRRRARA
jgi:hypothetical protein